MTKYRCELIDKILSARSGEEVVCAIEAAMKGLKEHKVNGHLIIRFVEKAGQDLDGYAPGHEDIQRRANIQTGRILLAGLKRTILENENEFL